ncbi:MAG: hypothetical protein J6C26_09875 [Clostridia bacterium]|nr:hypothetical protein [Clostridia bacterium]
MRKILSFVLVLTVFLSFCIPLVATSEASEPIQIEYSYLESVAVLYGNHECDEDGNILAGEAVFDDLWAFEYLDLNARTFHPMTGYFATSHYDEGWLLGGRTEIYVPTVESAWKKGPLTFCGIRNSGQYITFGSGAGVSVSFIVPKSGVVSFNTAVSIFGQRLSTELDGGVLCSLFLNETKIWPEQDKDGYLYADVNPDTNPKPVSLDGINVSVGDRLRLVLEPKSGTVVNPSTVSFAKDPPKVIYESFEGQDPLLPIGYYQSSAFSYMVKYDQLKIEKNPEIYGMNVYLNGEKINRELITDKQFDITIVDQRNVQYLGVETVGESGQSYRHEDIAFRVVGQICVLPPPVIIEAPNSDPPENNSDPDLSETITDSDGSPSVSSEPITDDPDMKNEEPSDLRIFAVIGCVGGVVVLSAILLLLKKKYWNL